MPKSDPVERLESSKNSGSPGVQAGVLAAGMLGRACGERPADSEDERLGLYLDSAGGLARGLGAELAALSERIFANGASGSDSAALVSGALRAADLATLAACTVTELPSGSPARLRVTAATHLAAAAARSLTLERRALGQPGDHETRDLRGAEWRASLAVRQVEEALQEGS